MTLILGTYCKLDDRNVNKDRMAWLSLIMTVYTNTYKRSELGVTTFTVLNCVKTSFDNLFILVLHITSTDFKISL